MVCRWQIAAEVINQFQPMTHVKISVAVVAINIYNLKEPHSHCIQSRKAWNQSNLSKNGSIFLLFCQTLINILAGCC